MKMNPRVAREVISIIASGQPPMRGVENVLVGRENEVKSFQHSMQLIKGGGSNCKFVIGNFGSGKTMLKQYYKWLAINEKFVVMDANLSEKKRFTGSESSHYGLNTYRELINNLSIKDKPDGDALSFLLSNWFTEEKQKAVDSFNSANNSNSFTIENIYTSLVDNQISKDLVSILSGTIYYSDFKEALLDYYHSLKNGVDYPRSSDWFKGVLETKKEAHEMISSGRYIKEDNWFEFMKMWAKLVKGMGYRGLIVLIDETEAIYKLPFTESRNTQYVSILDKYNELNSNGAPYLGMFLFGTPHFLDDPHRGIYSYKALGDRLRPSRFGLGFEGDYSPIIMLRKLTVDHVAVYLVNITRIYELGQNYSFCLSEDELKDVVIDYIRAVHYTDRPEDMLSPREVSREYIAILDSMRSTGSSFYDILRGGVTVVPDHNPDDDLFMI